MTRSAPTSAAGIDDLRGRLASGVDTSAGADIPRTLHAALPPDVDPLDLWSASPPSDPAWWWETSEAEVCGIGACGDQPVGPIRCFGALPFSDDPGPEWAGLADTGFVVPRWSVRRDVDGTTLDLALRDARDLAERAMALSELDRVAAVLGSPHVSAGPAPGRGSGSGLASGEAEAGRASRVPSVVLGETADERAAWTNGVRRALAEIEAGRFRKTVLARRVDVSMPRGMDPAALLRRLRSEGAGRYRFGLRRGDVAFVGASPETLFRKQGRQVEVEALAGTYDLDAPVAPVGVADDAPPTGDAPAQELARAAEHLFASQKEREEHALVVRGIVDALAPLADSVATDEWPQVREARRLAHLSTTVRATLAPGVGTPELIEALHPTPAVGGLPREPAVAFLLRSEAHPRGLFAGPIGWTDAAGDACFAVGIRSALVRDGRATLFAGAGIVAASDPDAEWAETSAKMRWFRELVGETA